MPNLIKMGGRKKNSKFWKEEGETQLCKVAEFMKHSLGFRRNRSSHDARDQPRHGNVLGHLEVERDGDHGELVSVFSGFRAPCHYCSGTMFKSASSADFSPKTMPLEF